MLSDPKTDPDSRREAAAILARSEKKDVAEGKADVNFTPEDLKQLEGIRDLATLKVRALQLISRPSARPMKPEKVEWFKGALDRMTSPAAVIKLMYDLLLSGEGHSVLGSRNSMRGNTYRQRFGENADAELAEPPERPRKTTTKTKEKPKLDPNMFGPKLDQPLAKADPLDDIKRNAGVGGDRPEVNIRKASQQRTLDKTSGLGTPEMGDMLGRLRNIEVSPDLEPYQQDEPETLPSVDVNTKNLPAVAGQALQAAGVQDPEFHQVANLPGNMADQIRQLGKSLFGSLTMTPTKRIYVVANLGGKGPNTSQEVNAVAGFLKQHGDDRGPGNIDFDQVMPGYNADTHMFSAAGIRWMLVKDFAGQYIYCWPEADSHDAVDSIEHDTDTKRLR